MSELPGNWRDARLTDIVDLHDSRRVPLNKEERQKRQGPYPYYGANGLVDYIDGYLFNGEYVLLAEDGGYFEDPARGVAYEVSGKFWVNNHAHILSPRDGISNRFLTHLLNSLEWLPYVGGSTRLKLTQAGMQQVCIPVPPLPEQRRIVAKLDSLRARTNRARTELDHIPKLIERYKQAILAKAFSGQLTANWRASKHLHKWRTATIAELGDVKGGKRLPKGHEYVPGPTSHPYLRVTDFRNGSVNLSGLRYIDKHTHSLISRYTITSEDIYISIAGSIGFVGTIPGVLSGANLTENAAKICNLRGVNRDYLAFFLGSPGAQRRIVELTVATGQPKLALFRIESIEVSLPTIEEQIQIVERIKQSFNWLDKIATEHARAENLLPKLDQAILAKAFRGELVPQDPNDEPASALLERIRAARGADDQSRRRRRS